jgi:proteic killer suppression protein
MEKALLKTIQSFADKDTEDFFFVRRRIRKWEKIVKKVSLVLTILNSVTALNELKISFGARLHKLHGDREGQWSVSINKQYRVCFYWEKKHAYEVEITDYH